MATMKHGMVDSQWSMLNGYLDKLGLVNGRQALKLNRKKCHWPSSKNKLLGTHECPSLGDHVFAMRQKAAYDIRIEFEVSLTSERLVLGGQKDKD